MAFAGLVAVGGGDGGIHLQRQPADGRPDRRPTMIVVAPEMHRVISGVHQDRRQFSLVVMDITGDS